MGRVKGAFLLIFASILLLLSVNHINKTFKDMRATTEETLDIREGVLTPTRENPLKLEYNTKDISIGGKADLTLSFMNPSAEDKYCQLSVYDNTNNLALLDLSEDSWIIYNHNPTSKISPEQISVWKIFMEDKELIKQTKSLTVVVCCADSSEEGDVSCSVDIDDGVEFRKDFILNIS